jgi:hypothetical protein
MKITVSPKWVLTILLVATILLVIVGITGSYLKYAFDNRQINMVVRLFDLDGEANIPSFFSSLILLFSSLLLYYIALSRKKVRRDFLAWIILSVVFLFLSLDEAAMIHEMMINTLKRALNLSGLFYNAWVIPYGIAAIAGAVIYLPFLLRLPRTVMILFLVAGVIFISGAVVVEMFEGRYEAVYGTSNFNYDSYVAVEECMEMTGITIFIYALLKYLSCSTDTLTIEVKERNDSHAG